MPLQFDFLNPGARSLALGSAFTGLADDATSAFTNPAGLTLLARTEISFEGRYKRLTTPFLERGRLSGALTNRGDDTVAGAQYGESSDGTGNPSFISFVFPRSRWAVAAYRHELVKLRDTFQARGTFQDVVSGGVTLQVREAPLDAVRTMDISNYGVAGAYRVTDRLSIGGGVSLYHMSLESSFRRFDTVGDSFGPPDFSRERSVVTQDGDDSDLAFSGGIQLTLHPRVRVGAVYRNGPKFDVQLEEKLGTISLLRRDGALRVPNAFSTGIMIRPVDSLTLAFDYAFVEYTSFKDDYIDMQTGTRPEQFVIEDGHEFHGGLEYVFASAPALPALRFGAWYDPDHAVRYQPTAANDGFDTRFAATLPGGENLVHYTAGLGLSFTSQFELNVAGDFTTDRSTFSTSVIYRFK